MPKNPYLHHELDIGQIQRRVFDPENDSLRISMNNINELYTEINAKKDSITAVPPNLSIKASISSNTPLGDVISPISCVGIKNLDIYTKGNLEAIRASISPSDEDNIWFSIHTPAKGINARRVKVELTDLIDSEYDIYFGRCLMAKIFMGPKDFAIKAKTEYLNTAPSTEPKKEIIEVEKIVHIIKEVPVEVIKHVEVQVIKEVEKLVHVPVEKIVEIIKHVEVPVIKEIEKLVHVPINTIKRVEVLKVPKYVWMILAIQTVAIICLLIK